MGVKVVKRIGPLAPGVGKAVEAAMPRVAAYLQSSADKKIRDGVPPPNSALTAKVKSGDKTLRDSGALAASIARHCGRDWAEASTNLPYAKINQEGGVIQAGRKGLWIPAGAETKRLMRKYGATRAGELIRAMRGEYSLFRRGRVFCAAKKTKRGDEKVFPLFIIAKKVKIPARPFLYITDKDSAFIMKTISRFIQNGLEGKGK